MGKDSNWGYLPHLTPEQKQMLADLRKRVDAELPKKDWLAKDTELLRFCRARNFNPTKTFSMLKEDVEWREPFENFVYVRNRDFGGAYAMHEEGAIRLAGKAKDGRPVVMVQARYYWPNLVDNNIQIVYFFTFYVDAICRMAEQVGQETFYAIADLEGFSMANFSLPQIKIAISILQNHYPERLGMIFVINAPFVFTAAWRLIQPLLDARTRNKIEILGSDYFSQITKHIDPDQIEKPWGGTHDKWPIPDEIVQIAIDNENNLIEEQQNAMKAEAIALAAPTTPPASTEQATPPPEARPTSQPGLEVKSLSDVSASTRKSLGVRKAVKRMVRKMLFTTDKRALANSMGADPDAPEMNVPKRLSATGLPKESSSPTKMLKTPSSSAGKVEEEEGDVDVATDLEKDLFEVKEAHDKVLAKVEALEKQFVAYKKNSTQARRFIQQQVFLLLGMVLAVMYTLIREKFLRNESIL